MDSNKKYIEQNILLDIFYEIFIPLIIVDHKYDNVIVNREFTRIFGLENNLNLDEINQIIPKIKDYINSDSLNTQIETTINKIPTSIQVIYLSKQKILVIIKDMSKEDMLWNQLKQAHKMELIGQMASGITHDFNNLLTVIGGYANIVRKKLADSSLKEYMDNIYKSVDKGSATLRSLLTFSRSSTGDYKVSDLNSVIQDLEKIAKNILQKYITLEVNLCNSTLPVMCDAVQLEHSILNLIINAQDAMPNGGKIILSTYKVNTNELMEFTDKSQKYAKIDVVDTGVGMSEETLKNIFTPFFTTKPPNEGTGLGLTMINNTIKNHNGQIYCESKLGKGTKFTIYLPLSE